MRELTALDEFPENAGHRAPSTLQCQYPSKPCLEPRAVKLNGQLHKLCELHRQQANRNQQNLQRRRKLREFEELQQYMQESFGFDHMVIGRSGARKPVEAPQSPLRSDDEGEREFGPDELEILQSLLAE